MALLGAWVDPVLFRGGAVLEALDHVAARVGESVLLSTAANYTLHHLHIVPGVAETSVIDHAGHADSFLHTPQGRLPMSSYRDTHIRSALHRLNADEPDPSRRVRVSETLEALRKLRKQGHVVEPDARADGTGVVSILLPPLRRVERLKLSVIASSETIAARSDEILAIMQEEREHILPRVRQVATPSQPRTDMGLQFGAITEIGEGRAPSHEPESLVA